MSGASGKIGRHESEVAGGARTAHEPLPPFKPAAAAPRGVHVHGHHHRAGVERARQLLLGEAPLGCHARKGRLCSPGYIL